MSKTKKSKLLASMLCATVVAGLYASPVMAADTGLTVSGSEVVADRSVTINGVTLAGNKVTATSLQLGETVLSEANLQKVNNIFSSKKDNTKPAIYVSGINVYDASGNNNFTVSSAGAVTAKGGATISATGTDNRKTTSQVTYSGVTDTVYANNGGAAQYKAASSSVTASSITDTVYGTDGRTALSQMSLGTTSAKLASGSANFTANNSGTVAINGSNFILSTSGAVTAKNNITTQGGAIYVKSGDGKTTNFSVSNAGAVTANGGATINATGTDYKKTTSQVTAGGVTDTVYAYNGSDSQYKAATSSIGATSITDTVYDTDGRTALSQMSLGKTSAKLTSGKAGVTVNNDGNVSIATGDNGKNGVFAVTSENFTSSATSTTIKAESGSYSATTTTGYSKIEDKVTNGAATAATTTSATSIKNSVDLGNSKATITTEIGSNGIIDTYTNASGVSHKVQTNDKGTTFTGDTEGNKYNTTTINGSQATFGGSASSTNGGQTVITGGKITTDEVYTDKLTVGNLEITEGKNGVVSIGGTDLQVNEEGQIEVAGLNIEGVKLDSNGLKLGAAGSEVFTVDAATGNITTNGRINGVTIGVVPKDASTFSTADQAGDVKLNNINVSAIDRNVEGIIREGNDNDGYKTTIEGVASISEAKNGRPGTFSIVNGVNPLNEDVFSVNDYGFINATAIDDFTGDVKAEFILDDTKAELVYGDNGITANAAETTISGAGTELTLNANGATISGAGTNLTINADGATFSNNNGTTVINGNKLSTGELSAEKLNVASGYLTVDNSTVNVGSGALVVKNGVVSALNGAVEMGNGTAGAYVKVGDGISFYAQSGNIAANSFNNVTLAKENGNAIINGVNINDLEASINGEDGIASNVAGISRDDTTNTTTIEGATSFNANGMTTGTITAADGKFTVDQYGVASASVLKAHSVIFDGGSISATGISAVNGKFVVDQDGNVKSFGDIQSENYSLETVGEQLNNLETNFGNTNENVAGIKRDGETTTIEEHFSVSSDGTIDAFTKNSTFSMTEDAIAFGVNGVNGIGSIAIQSGDITLHGNVHFTGNDGNSYTLADLEDRVSDLEDKTQNIDSGSTHGPSEPGEGEGPVDNGANTGINGDLTVGGSVNAGEGNFTDKVTVGDKTQIGDGNISVGEDGNKTTIDNGNITVDNGEEGKVVIGDGDVSVIDKDGNEVGSIMGNAQDIADIREDMGAMSNRISKVEDRIDKVGAMSAAIANLRTMGYDPTAPTEIAVGIGQYRSETGAALGLFHYPNKDFMLSLSVSTSGDEVMGGIGATWKFGRKSPEQMLAAEKEKAAKAKLAKAEAMKKAAAEAKVAEQQAKHAKMAAEKAAK